MQNFIRKVILEAIQKAIDELLAKRVELDKAMADLEVLKSQYTDQAAEIVFKTEII